MATINHLVDPLLILRKPLMQGAQSSSGQFVYCSRGSADPQFVKLLEFESAPFREIDREMSGNRGASLRVEPYESPVVRTAMGLARKRPDISRVTDVHCIGYAAKPILVVPIE
jgi:hypothetical protein